MDQNVFVKDISLQDASGQWNLKDIEKKILDDIEPLLQTMDIAVVEINAAVVNRKFTVRLVIFRESGVSLGDCEAVYKVLKPRLELILESREPTMEITSPGIDRKIKSSREYAIFKGKGLRLLTEDSPEWINGFIQDCDDKKLILKVGDADTEIPLNIIKKAKLDYTMEAR